MNVPDPASMPAYQIERRGGIVKAAQELLQERDPDEIHVRDVAARAGVALGTVYRYFGSKDLLYAVALREWGQPVSTPPHIAALSPADRFRARLRFAVRALGRNPSYLRIVLMLRTCSDVAAAAECQAFAASLTAPMLDDLSALGAREAQDVALMGWCLVTDLLGQQAHGIIEPVVSEQTLESFCTLVRTRLEAAGE